MIANFKGLAYEGCVFWIEKEYNLLHKDWMLMV
jgi:hypothetical protein